MRRTFVLAVALSALVAACTSSTTPVPPAGNESSVPAQSLSPVSPPPQVVNGCTIAPNTDCHDASLRTAVLHDSDLHGANLAGADLYGADLRRANLSGADLSSANLGNADMTGALVTGANLAGADLQHTNLTKTDLSGATAKNGQIAKALTCQTTLPNGRKDNSGCQDGSSKSPSPSPSPNKGGKAPSITRFLVSPSTVKCSSTSDETSVKVRYATLDTTAVQFQIDSEPPTGHYPAKETAHLAFDCGAKMHTYKIIALGTGTNQDTDQFTVKRGKIPKSSPSP